MNKRIETYEGLRFIMVMLIVVSHQSFFGEISPFNVYFPKYYSFAVLGVDYFFLLSGFGMMLSNLKSIQTKDLAFSSVKDNVSFAIKHVKKIYPLYITTILIGLLYDVILRLLDGDTFSTIFLYDSLKLALAVPLLQSATGTMTFGHAFNGVGWFLSTLFCIYLVSPWLIYWLRKYSNSIKSIVFFLLFDFVFIILLAFLFGKIEAYTQRIGMTVPIDQLVYISPYRRVFYVMVGMGLGMLYFNSNCQIKLFSKSPTLWEIFSLLLAIFYFVFRNCFIESLGAFIWGADLLICVFIMLVFAQNWGGADFLFVVPKKHAVSWSSLHVYISYPLPHKDYRKWYI